jgi:hypothetical protein
LVSSIKDWKRFKTLCMAWASIDFKCVNTSSFCNTTFFEPSWFDVLVFNSLNVSYNLSFDVSSYNLESKSSFLYVLYTSFHIMEGINYVILVLSLL